MRDEWFICGFQDGKSDVVANEAGDRTTPAIVAFTDHDVVSVPAGIILCICPANER